MSCYLPRFSAAGTRFVWTKLPPAITIWLPVNIVDDESLWAPRRLVDGGRCGSIGGASPWLSAISRFCHVTLCLYYFHTYTLSSLDVHVISSESQSSFIKCSVFLPSMMSKISHSSSTVLENYLSADQKKNFCNAEPFPKNLKYARSPFSQHWRACIYFSVELFLIPWISWIAWGV